MKISVALCFFLASTSFAGADLTESKTRNLRIREGRHHGGGSDWKSIFHFATKKGNGNSDTCPPINPAVTCLYDPDTANDVVCGDAKCAYNNQCEASGAGWKERECTLAAAAADDVCPPRNDTVPCVFIYAPVQCGKNDCFYDNECEALTAGWAQADCSPMPTKDDKPTCPELNPLIRCADDDPTAHVLCGNAGCMYNNFCESTGAGWKETDCAVIYNDPMPVDLCPPMDSLILCAPSTDGEVVCGANACVYPGLCEAAGAGFAETECSKKQEDAPTCPPPSPAVTCPYEPDTSNQVACGDNNCIYNNQCEASGAGFREDQCVKQPQEQQQEAEVPTCQCITTPCDCDVACPSEKPEVMCPDVYMPVSCGDNKCIYSNACQAAGAGWDAAQCTNNNDV